jgi:dCTP deaminase
VLLSTEEIRRRMHDETLSVKDRLLITPVLDWSAQAKAGQAAIDLRLGQRFTVPRRTKLYKLDALSPTRAADLARYNDKHHVWIGDYFVLHPRQFVLGETLEWLHMPPSLAGLVTSRSSWGRDGLVIATATGVHPGYSGILTLELTNVGEIPVSLYPGIAVAQLFLFEVMGSEGMAIAPSSFGLATAPTTGDPANRDRRIIEAIRKLRGVPDGFVGG